MSRTRGEFCRVDCAISRPATIILRNAVRATLTSLQFRSRGWSLSIPSSRGRFLKGSVPGFGTLPPFSCLAVVVRPPVQMLPGSRVQPPSDPFQRHAGDEVWLGRHDEEVTRVRHDVVDRAGRLDTKLTSHAGERKRQGREVAPNAHNGDSGAESGGRILRRPQEFDVVLQSVKVAVQDKPFADTHPAIDAVHTLRSVPDATLSGCSSFGESAARRS